MNHDAEVLIVGAGPVGLALAGDLGWRGRRCIVVDRGDGSIFQPKMDMVGIRTMEFCRRWNIVRDVEESPYPRDYPQDNVYLTSLNGYELGRERFPPMGADRPPPVSPQKRERCPQNMFDPILRRFAESFPSVGISYRTEFVDFSETADGVRVEVRDLESQTSRTITARYIVGCDGARSSVGQKIGVSHDGTGVLTYTTNVIFRCPDFNDLHPKDPGYRYIFIGPEGTWGTIVAINGRDQWRMSIIGSKTPQAYTENDIRGFAYRALGKEFPLEILSIVPWTRSELIARTYRRGRAFLAGDAAHVMSPTGGFGMNTGIGDAVDLSWKLAAVLEGWGGEALLESYEIERRPVAVRNVHEASGNLQRMLSPKPCPVLLDDTEEGAEARRKLGAEFSEAMKREWYTLDIHLGYIYADSPICIHDDRVPPQPSTFGVYVQTTRPGARAPHLWLDDGSSTLDLFGRGFVLMMLGEARDVGSLRKAASAHGIPLAVHHIPEPSVASAYEQPLVLVRPDGHVAWRGAGVPENPELMMLTVAGQAV